MTVEPFAGRVWKFGDNINTDLIVPKFTLSGTEQEQVRAIFSANRPGWAQQVEKGDIIVAGRNFGTGSGRPAPRSLRNAGIACLISESISGLFFRNSVNYGLLALETPGAFAAFEEGQTAEVSLADFTVRNRQTGVLLQTRRLPDELISLMTGGGLYPVLERQGLIAPVAPGPAIGAPS